jgi:hypothetical protein
MLIIGWAGNHTFGKAATLNAVARQLVGAGFDHEVTDTERSGVHELVKQLADRIEERLAADDVRTNYDGD